MKRLIYIFFLVAFAQLAFGQIDIVSGVAKPFGYSNDISPSQITSNQNDYNPTGLSTASVLRLNSDASRNITGLQGGADGRIIVIYNVGTTDIVLKNEDATSTAAYRFTLGADLTLKGSNGVTLYYDATTSRWRVVSNSTPTYGTYQASPSDPTLTTSATVVMMGLAGSFTPSATGKVLVIMSGDNGNNNSKIGTREIRYGTGSAPANGDASTGTAATPTHTFQEPASARGAWSLQGVVSGLTVGTAYWFDLGLSRSAGNIQVKNVSISIIEL